jgi:hypothetical protein
MIFYTKIFWDSVPYSENCRISGPIWKENHISSWYLKDQFLENVTSLITKICIVYCLEKKTLFIYNFFLYFILYETFEFGWISGIRFCRWVGHPAGRISRNRCIPNYYMCAHSNNLVIKNLDLELFLQNIIQMKSIATTIKNVVFTDPKL